MALNIRNNFEGLPGNGRQISCCSMTLSSGPELGFFSLYYFYFFSPVVKLCNTGNDEKANILRDASVDRNYRQLGRAIKQIHQWATEMAHWRKLLKMATAAQDGRLPRRLPQTLFRPRS